MGWGKPDVYYNAESFGLTRVDEIDLSDGFYQFDIVCVWKDAGAKHYWAEDSGCSCPLPFEDYTTIEKTTPLDNDHDFEELKKIIDEENSWRTDRTLEEKTKFLNTVRASMKGNT